MNTGTKTGPGTSPRSLLMSKIRSTNTVPELQVRRTLFAMGYRFRIHVKTLPGSPDIAFFSRRKVIFVNGCFWHQHPHCAKATLPAINKDYWLPKLERNKKRDEKAISDLKQQGWKVLTIWECEAANFASMRKRLKRFLGAPRFAHSREPKPQSSAVRSR